MPRKVIKPKKYKITKVYKIEDLVYDMEDQDEIKDAEPYVGKYVMKRMTHGGIAASQKELVKIQARIKPEDKEEGKIEIDDFVPDFESYQNTMLIYTMVDSPFGKMPEDGWDDQHLDDFKKFVFKMPRNLYDDLLDITVELNNITKEERKN